MKKTKKEIKIIPFYTCPYCKKKQTRVIEWQNMSVAYKFNLKTGNSEKTDNEVWGEHEQWSCAWCNKELPIKIVKKIEKILGWYG